MSETWWHQGALVTAPSVSPHPRATTVEDKPASAAEPLVPAAGEGGTVHSIPDGGNQGESSSDEAVPDSTQRSNPDIATTGPRKRKFPVTG